MASATASKVNNGQLQDSHKNWQSSFTILILPCQLDLDYARSSENLEMKAFEKFENAVFFQDIQNSFW